MLISRNLHKKSSEVYIKTRSPPASLSFKGQATKHTTVKWSISLEMAENIFFKGIYDGDLCKVAESFEDQINITNKVEKEAKTVEKSRFVELLEDDKIYIIKQIKEPKQCITL